MTPEQSIKAREDYRKRSKSRVHYQSPNKRKLEEFKLHLGKDAR